MSDVLLMGCGSSLVTAAPPSGFTYVNSHIVCAVGANDAAIPLPSSYADGQLCIVVQMNDSSSGFSCSLNGSVMTSVLADSSLGGARNNIRYALVAGGASTINATSCIANTPFQIILLTGATSIAVAEAGVAGIAGASQVDFVGYTPNGSSKGELISAWTSNGTGNFPPSTLSGYTARMANARGSSTWYGASLFELIPATGAAKSVTGYTTGASQPWAHRIEVL